MTCGIYEILNTANGKRYIGSSVNVELRTIHHRSCLKNNKHHSYHLQAAWKAYGEGSFDFNILLVCGKWDLKFYEQALMERYKSYDREYGYNISPNAYRAEHCSEECRKALRQRARSKAKKYDWKGKKLCLSEIAEIEGIADKTIHRRVLEYGWSIERAVLQPIGKFKSKIKVNGTHYTFKELSDETGIKEQTLRSRYAKGRRDMALISDVIPQEKIVEFNGRSMNISAWSKITGVPHLTLVQRLGKLGWSIEDALTKEVQA